MIRNQQRLGSISKICVTAISKILPYSSLEQIGRQNPEAANFKQTITSYSLIMIKLLIMGTVRPKNTHDKA